LSAFNLSAQENLNSDQFFEQAFEQLSEAGLKENVSIKFPWIEELQFRTETRDFDFDRQEYTLRLSPSTPKKIKAQEALLSHYQSSPDQKSSRALQKVISSLYLDWLSLYFINQELEMLDELEIIWNDKKTILQKLIGQHNIDFKDLISLEKDKNELAQLRYELQLELKTILSLYSQDDGIDPDFSPLPSYDHIEATIKKLSAESLMASATADPLYAYKQEELLKEIALEEAEGNQYFDFIQLRYRGPHENFWEERLAVGLGFQWPNDGNRKLKLAELKMEQDLLVQEKELENNESLREATISRTKLEQRIDKAKHFANLKAQEATELEKISKAIQQKQGFDPMIILDLKESAISSRIKILDYEKDVFEEYVKYLSSLGKLGAMPFVNYLKA